MALKRLPGRLLERAFFEAAVERVAPRLLGKLLVHRTSTGVLAGRIVEVEAYLGPHQKPADPAAHSYRGPTERNRVIFGPAGYAYVYAIYGRYFCMNISCEREGRAGCVLVRALEPVIGLKQMARNRGLEIEGNYPEKSEDRLLPLRQLAKPPQGWGIQCVLTSGPGRLCQALNLNREIHNGLDLLDPRSPLQVRDDGTRVKQVLVTRRIGIRHAVDLPLRFVVAGHECASGSRKIAGEIMRSDRRG